VVGPNPSAGMFGGRESGAEIFIPFSTARKENDRWFNVVAAAKSPDVSEEAKAEITFFLRRERHIRPGDPDTFRVQAVEQWVQKFKEMAVMSTMVAAGVVGISLIVGGIGIMNIMLVSVSERTREIGLRKAVGARPSAVLLQFLVEAVTICFVGGLLGILGGQGIVKLFAFLPAAKLGKAYIPLWAIGLAFGFSALVGLIFGMFPAIKASRLDPIEALRHE
jgi:putative ABC transport system permease protein